MSRSFSGLLPFDGTCRGGNDGNLTLTFISESPLEIDKGTLDRASPILKAMIEQGEDEGTLFLGSDDRLGWLLMLHFLHPQAGSLMIERVHDLEISELDAMIAIVNKYAVSSVMNALDRVMDHYIRQRAAALHHFASAGGRAAMFSPVLQDKMIFYIMTWSVCNQLKKTTEACNHYLQRCLSLCFRIHSPDPTPRAGCGGYELSELIREISDMGYKDVAVQVARALLGCMVLDS